jgi:hypothetical protein
MTNAIALPEKTQERLENLVRTQQETQRLIDTIVATAREALNVPDDWTISDVRVGFVAPVDQPPA